MEGAAGKFAELFAALRKTEDVPERLELQGLASRGDGGDLVLREDVRGPVEDLEARLKASLDSGASYRGAAGAAKLDVDHRNVTYVIYALFPTDGGEELYIGESGQTMTERFEQHPDGCPELTAAMEKTGGKDAWTCVVILVLPEDARSKELLLYIEARIQRLLDTVDGAHGLNCHYGAGTYGGAPDEDQWVAKYVDFAEFISERGRLPSTKSKNSNEKTVGVWAQNQRSKSEQMSTHRRDALDALGSMWKWKINAPPVPNSTLFAKLRADDRVTASGGMFIPIDIFGAQRVKDARRQFANGAMPESERDIIREEFPGLEMPSGDAAFRLNAEAFSKAHPGAFTRPSKTKERALCGWLNGLQRGAIAMTKTREKILEDFGISVLLKTLKSPEFRAETVARQNAYNAARHAEAREAKKRRMLDDISTGSNELCSTRLPEFAEARPESA